MRLLRGLIGIVASMSFIGQALAAPNCYRNDEVEAALAVKFMTELMVLNDSCEQHVYEGFVRSNLKILGTYHKAWVEHFKAAGDRKAEDTVDRNVTKIANQMALTAGSMPIQAFCASKAAFFATVGTLSGEKFHQHLVQLASEQKDYQSCERRSAQQ